VFSIPAHVAFVDALAQGLVARCPDPLDLARAQVFLPNRRAVRALTEAFVRVAGGGLLLPRMTPVGDLSDDAFDRFAGGEAALPPAVSPLRRRLELARLVRARPEALSAVEALRLGDQLGGALDDLLAEEVPPERLRELVAASDLARHWQDIFAFLDIVITAWPPARDATGGSDGGTRLAALIDALIGRWRADPPTGVVVAAGITGSSPSLVRLLKALIALPRGLLVLPGLDTEMSPAAAARWDAISLGQSETRDSEAHPQFALKALLARLGLARDEVQDWGVTTAMDGPAARTAAVMAAMAPAAAADWPEGGDTDDFTGVTAIEAATSAEEAQAIAIALRRALETPGQTAALVTPDRVLARRVALHCRRWGLAIDDSAGEPLRLAPPGALALALTEAIAAGFSPVALLAALKHPLAAVGEGRPAWLAQVRALDLVLRGVRPPPGLDSIAEAIDAYFAEARARLRRRGNAAPDRLAALDATAARLAEWWNGTAAMLEPLADLRDAGATDLARLAEALRVAGSALAGDRLWSGTDGRALAGLVERLEADGAVLGRFDIEDAPALLSALLNDVAVRAPWGGHPRLRILGPLEAQLQRADLMILGGLNEGIWPQKPAPDPWLAPVVRTSLGLPGLARATGLAAHDFVGALGAPRVLITRARRDASAPLVPSRFWLRLQAYTGGLSEDKALLRLARSIDGGGTPALRAPPQPAPPRDKRPRQVALTAIDTLITDPFAYYARSILRLEPLDPLDQDPTAAERGTALHDVLERWTNSGGGSLERLEQFANEMLVEQGKLFPLLRALWGPRARRALLWAGEAIHARELEGWQPIAAEAAGQLTLPNGITITGRADRIDRHEDDGRLAVIDYKTGTPPSGPQVKAGLANQLGLLLAMACGGRLVDRDGRPVPGGAPGAIHYWQLKGGEPPGEVTAPLNGRNAVTAADHVTAVLDRAEQRTRLLLQTDAPFLSKRYPGQSWADYDHLARVAEWQNRPRSARR
jgi:ATP-dependent helicase/nuclease subunit B